MREWSRIVFLNSKVAKKNNIPDENLENFEA
jgi:hypothetical protein